VDQISPPFRIAIVAMLAVCALWFTVLKPKDPAADSAPLPTAPGVTGLSNDVNAAKGAAKASDAANAKVQSATGGTAGTSTTGTTTTATAGKPAATTAEKSVATGAHAAVDAKNGGVTAPTSKQPATSTDPAAPLLSALDAKKAVVLLFWNAKGADDRAVRRAVAAMNRRHGRVVVKAVPVAKIGQYEAITSDARVMQAPTALVIGPDRKARAIAGFTTTAELNQAAGDALGAAAK
jgi:hypothetical protein